MAKVKVIRQSGNAVDIEANKAYVEEFQSRYDELKTECGLDMEKMHKKLEELDAELELKYDVISVWDLPDSKIKWKKLIAEYGSFMVSEHVHTGELLLVVMDIGI